MNRSIRRLLLATLVMLAVVPLALAQPPEGTITFSGGSVAAGIGYTWGNGILHFRGRNHPFTVSGLSVVDIGVANIQGVGEVYNLRQVKDFPGTYVAAGAGATIAGGGSVAVMENQNGVIIHFHSTTEGLKLNLSASGISIGLK